MPAYYSLGYGQVILVLSMLSLYQMYDYMLSLPSRDQAISASQCYYAINNLVQTYAVSPFYLYPCVSGSRAATSLLLLLFSCWTGLPILSGLTLPSLASTHAGFLLSLPILEKVSLLVYSHAGLVSPSCLASCCSLSLSRS
jgi:hypothetical protein